jgi:hypothetical protein
MRIAQPNLFREFEDVIGTLPVRDRFQRGDLLIPSLLLHREDSLEMYYAPFGAVNPSASVVLLGITPGWTQMEIAYRSARSDLDRGFTSEEICARAKQSASFAGTMRTNLVRMLDDLGLPSLLGIPSSSDLFASATQLVHMTSAIRYPVFVKGQNYTGHTPAILRSAFLRECVDVMLASELLAVPHAIIVPLGNAVSETLAYLADRGRLSPERCLFGFPHPSGANGRRVRDFTAHRERLAKKMEAHFPGMPNKSTHPTTTPHELPRIVGLRYT